VAPLCDAVHARAVLQGHGVADVGKLAVLEDDKVVLVGEARELGGERGREVLDDVDVGLG
jgi:hypothetical protein